jgi:O-antigen ligase
VTNAGRYPGFTDHVSDLGGVASVAAAFCLLAMGKVLHASHRRALSACLAICTIGLVLSGSVSGMIAVLTAAAALLIRHTIALRRIAVFGIAGMAGLSYLQIRQSKRGALTPWDRLLQVTGRTERPPPGARTGEFRLNLIRAAWSEIRHHPLLGRGLAPRDGTLIDDLGVHNVLLAAWYGGGLLTFAGVALVGFSALAGGWRRRYETSLEALFAATIAAVTFAMTAPSVFNRYYWLPIVMLIIGVHLWTVEHSAPRSAMTRPGGHRLGQA